MLRNSSYLSLVVLLAACTDRATLTPTEPSGPRAVSLNFGARASAPGTRSIFPARGSNTSDARRPMADLASDVRLRDKNQGTGGAMFDLRGDLCGSGTGTNCAPLGPMTVHSGSPMTSTTTYAIFWGSAWNTNAQFTNDKITAIGQLFGGYGGSAYANTTAEYDGPAATNAYYSTQYAYASPQSTFAGTLVDNGPAPAGSPAVSTVLGEVCSVLSRNGITPRSDGIYAVYGTTSRPPSDSACAWHSYGNCGSTQVKIAWFYSPDGDGGCQQRDASGIHSVEANSLANLSAHELAEAITDPLVNAWYASNTGGENGDKCAWRFPAANQTLSNGAQFLLQGEWSNHANNGRYGSSNRDGEPGCLYGQSGRHVLGIVGSGPQWVGAGYNSPGQIHCTWTAAPQFGTPPYTYQWSVSGGNNIVPSNGFTSQTFTVSQYTTASSYSQFRLQLTVTDATGQSDSDYRTVVALGSGNNGDSMYCHY